MNNVVSSERLHIGFFGKRNAGKSSLVNAITNQQLSVVSDIKGTTTDPVKKAMELLPLGPVVVIDTPGYDDEGELGNLRVQKTRQILSQTDIAILVIDSSVGMTNVEEEIIQIFKERKLSYILVYNKSDLIQERKELKENECYVSAKTLEGVHELKDKLGTFTKEKKTKYLISDMIVPGDIVVLVTPIDESAPKGRLILPQQLTIRDILDAHGIVVTCQDNELKQTLQNLKIKPKLVITDSQVFGKVSKDTPSDILLTSFSILMARYKGNLEELVKGASELSKLKDGDKVLISEGCTHHRQCNDIGTVKMPNWIKNYSNSNPNFTFTSGGEYPEDLDSYKVIVHCGGCMLNEKEMHHRIEKAILAGIPIVNYGIAIAHMNGILKRSVQPFPDVLKLLDE